MKRVTPALPRPGNPAPLAASQREGCRGSKRSIESVDQYKMPPHRWSGRGLAQEVQTP